MHPSANVFSDDLATTETGLIHSREKYRPELKSHVRVAVREQLLWKGTPIAKREKTAKHTSRQSSATGYSREMLTLPYDPFPMTLTKMKSSIVAADFSAAIFAAALDRAAGS